MKLILEKSNQMPFYTDMGLIFKSVGDLENMMWLVTDIECNYLPSDRLKEEPLWIDGRELKEIVSNHNLQFIWAVFTGFKKDFNKLKADNTSLPYADGNESIWDSSYNKQISDAIIEIICWDSSATIITSDDVLLMEKLKSRFSDLKDMHCK